MLGHWARGVAPLEKRRCSFTDFAICQFTYSHPFFGDTERGKMKLQKINNAQWLLKSKDFDALV